MLIVVGIKIGQPWLKILAFLLLIVTLASFVLQTLLVATRLHLGAPKLMGLHVQAWFEFGLSFIWYDQQEVFISFLVVAILMVATTSVLHVRRRCWVINGQAEERESLL